MSIKVKSGGAYADIVGAFVKQGGVYGAASVFAKVAGSYQQVSGSTPPPEPATIFASYNDVPSSFMGFATQPSAGRWNMTTVDVTPLGELGACFAYRIKGSSASMFAFSGDATPFRVMVDSDNFATATIPTISGGKIPLFSGLPDTFHDVFIFSDNSNFGQGFPAPTGNLIEAFGSAAQVLPLGQAWRLADPLFPGVFAGPSTLESTFFPNGVRRVQTAGHGISASSIHMRASYQKLWVFCNANATHVMVSINGALATACNLSATSGASAGSAVWRLVNTPAQSSAVDLIISGGGNETAAPASGQIMQGVMVSGVGASISTPTGTKRHVTMMGASQVEGVVNGARGYRIDGHLVQNRLPIYLYNAGLAGATIVNLRSALSTISARTVNKDIAMLSIGINSADDANFQPDYQSLIQACLDNGWTKVVCRGLVTTGNNASKNAKIAAAAASFSSPNVVYADVSTWIATVDGAGSTIAMPDGAHPNAAGFATMADYWVRDHASLFA